jgi:hypothetical protein
MSNKNSRRWRKKYVRKVGAYTWIGQARPPTAELLRVAKKFLDHPITKVAAINGDLEMRTDIAVIKKWVEDTEAFNEQVGTEES